MEPNKRRTPFGLTRKFAKIPSSLITRKLDYIWVLGIVALSFALKFSVLSNLVSLSTDYGSYLRFADILRGLDVRGMGLRYPPIFPAILTVFLASFDELEALRICAALLSSIVAIPFYFLAKKITRNRVLPMVVSLLAVFDVFYADMIGWGGNANILAISFIIAFLVFWLNSLERPHIDKNAFLAAFFLSLSIGTHFLAAAHLLIFALVFSFLLLLCRKDIDWKRTIKKSLFIGIMGLIFSVPYLFIYSSLLDSSVIYETSYSVADQRSLLSAMYFLSKNFSNIIIISLGVAGIFLFFRTQNRLLGLTFVSLLIAGCLPLFTQNAVRWLYFWPIPLFLGIIAFIEYVSNKMIKTSRRALGAIIIALLSVMIFTYMVYSVSYFQETSTYYAALTSESLAAIKWIKEYTPQKSIVATSGPYKRGSNGVGTIYGWWIEGYGERKCIATSYLRFLMYEDERVTSGKANIIFSGTDVIKNEYVMVGETFKAKLGNPEVGINVGDFFEKILFLNDNCTTINYIDHFYTASTTLSQMQYKDKVIMHTGDMKGIETIYSTPSNRTLRISKMVSIYNYSSIVDTFFEIEPEANVTSITIPIFKSDFVDLDSLTKRDREIILQVVTPMGTQVQVNISPEYNGTLEIQDSSSAPLAAQERGMFTFVFLKPSADNPIRIRFAFPKLVSGNQDVVEYYNTYESIKSLDINYILVNQYHPIEFERFSSDKDHFSKEFENGEVAVFRVTN